MNRAQHRTIYDNLELQGLPRDLLDHAPFTQNGKFEVVGNGVPLPMGKAIAGAICKHVLSSNNAMQPTPKGGAADGDR